MVNISSMKARHVHWYVVGALLLVLPSQAECANWKLYFQNQTGVSFFVDASSMAILEGSIVRAWEKQEWKVEDSKLGEGFLWLIEANCRERTYLYREIVPIKGTVDNLKMAASMMEIYRGTNYFQPNDLDEARYAALCGKARTK